MPNGVELVNELAYKEKIKKLSMEDKVDYLVDKVYDMNTKVQEINPASKKQTLGVSGATSFVVSVIAGLITYFKSGN